MTTDSRFCKSKICLRCRLFFIVQLEAKNNSILLICLFITSLVIDRLKSSINFVIYPKPNREPILNKTVKKYFIFVYLILILLTSIRIKVLVKLSLVIK